MASDATDRTSNEYRHWDEIEGRVRERWSQISEEDFETARGNIEQLVGVIQQKTGEARQQIESFVAEAVEDVAVKLDEFKRGLGSQTRAAAENLQQGYEKVASDLHHGYVGAREVVRRKPTESLAVAFGAGILTGVVVSLIMRKH